MSDKEQKSEKKEDPELDELLDSALKDFEEVSKKDDKDNENTEKEEENKNAEASGFKLPEMFTQNDELADNEAIQHMLEKDWISEMMQEMDKFKEMGNNPDFQSAISQALKDLSQTSENLQNTSPLLNEEELAAMFGRAGLEDQRPSDILPFMQGMMQSLLSKEVIYPSLKEIVDKYPGWLEEKKETLPAADLERFQKQLTLIQKICVEFEAEQSDDSDATKQQRFERTLSLMQEMQSCGQPPEELVGEQIFPVDSDGNLSLPFEPPQNCSVM